MYSLDFSGQLAVVTGGTRGIGRQIVDDLCSLGCKVITTGTKDAKSTDTVEYIQADFRDVKSVASLAERISKKDVDILINNAGINELNFIDLVKDGEVDDIFNVNLKAPIKLIAAVIPTMMRRLCGKIINISSVFGVVSRSRRSIYTTSKFGINGLTKTTAVELAQYGILVNSVSPGFIETDLTRNTLGTEVMKEMSNQIPIRRLGTPKEISKVVLFLSSTLNTYITGQNIIADGGFVSV